MRNIRISLLLIVFSFFFGTIPNTLQAVASDTTITGVEKEKSTIGAKIISIVKNIKTKIEKVLKPNSSGPSLFWLWATLLILAGLITGFVLIFLGFAIALTGGSTAAGTIALLLLLLGVFLPIVSLFFAFRPLLRKHYEKIGIDITKRKINLYAFLLSLVPGVIGLLWLALALI